jgi:hypothetical protein
MNGKIVAIGIVVVTLIFGAGQWYAQTRAYYERVGMAEIAIALRDGAEALRAELAQAEAIDADTSPLRFRLCARVPAAVAEEIAARAVPHPDPTPLIAPAWFECFDADALGADLEAGRAVAYTAQAEIERGVDRLIALYPDGRLYAWHQLNGTLE